MTTSNRVRARIVALFLALGVCYGATFEAIAHAAPAKQAKRAKRAPKRSDAPTVTYIDASGPSDESPFPTVVDKGRL